MVAMQIFFGTYDLRGRISWINLTLTKKFRFFCWKKTTFDKFQNFLVIDNFMICCIGVLDSTNTPFWNAPLSVVGGLLYSEDRGPQDDPKFWTPRILIFGGLGGWKFLRTFFGLYWHTFYLIKFFIRAILFLASMY